MRPAFRLTLFACLGLVFATARGENTATSDIFLNAYLACGEWQGKAGGYAVQGMAGAFIPWISGSYSGIMGLPLAETAALLATAGWPMWRQT